jgi:hypothetical protein
VALLLTATRLQSVCLRLMVPGLNFLAVQVMEKHKRHT